MGDEPYAALLPWAAFTIVDRAGGDPFWAGIGAFVTAVALLAMSTRGERRSRNTLLLGALVWFAGLALAGALDRTDAGALAHYGRAVSAAGFAVIAFGSLLFTPAVEYYTRPHIRAGRREDPAFRRVNVLLTSIWAVTFTGIALSHVVAASMNTPEAFTVFNWIVPLALATVAAHRTRISWDDFNDDDTFEADPMHDLALDWKPPLHPTDR